jgi:hypothetical protein
MVPQHHQQLHCQCNQHLQNNKFQLLGKIHLNDCEQNESVKHFSAKMNQQKQRP